MMYHVPHQTPPLPTTDAAAAADTAAWLKQHLLSDPELTALFLSAAETDWTPVVAFVRWALDRELLGTLRTPQPRNGRAA